MHHPMLTYGLSILNYLVFSFLFILSLRGWGMDEEVLTRSLAQPKLALTHSTDGVYAWPSQSPREALITDLKQ